MPKIRFISFIFPEFMDWWHMRSVRALQLDCQTKNDIKRILCTAIRSVFSSAKRLQHLLCGAVHHSIWSSLSRSPFPFRKVLFYIFVFCVRWAALTNSYYASQSCLRDASEWWWWHGERVRNWSKIFLHVNLSRSHIQTTCEITSDDNSYEEKQQQRN